MFRLYYCTIQLSHYNTLPRPPRPIIHHAKTQPLVPPLGLTPGLDLEAQRGIPTCTRLADHVPDERGADALPARLLRRRHAVDAENTRPFRQHTRRGRRAVQPREIPYAVARARGRARNVHHGLW